MVTSGSMGSTEGRKNSHPTNVFRSSTQLAGSQASFKGSLGRINTSFPSNNISQDSLHQKGNMLDEPDMDEAKTRNSFLP